MVENGSASTQNLPFRCLQNHCETR